MNSQAKNIVLIAIITLSYTVPSMAQGDSVIIRVGKDSKVIFSIKDKKDLETLKHYDFQALMNDMVQKLEKRDSTSITKPSSQYLKDSAQLASESHYDQWRRETAGRNNGESYPNDNGDNDNDANYENYKKRNRKTRSSFNIDIGMNNYLQNGKFTDANSLYTVKPWGSWYVALNSIWRTRMAKKFFLEWGGGVSWYNFKFENTKTLISNDANGVVFSEDQRNYDFQKSKLTVAYVNLSAVPMVDFGDNYRKAGFLGSRQSKSFRIGVGPYVGYRIDSYTKQMYYDNSEKYRSHNHDAYYLNNLRYGLRFQAGFRDTDIFFNYDMNDLFTGNKGPKVQAFSFGITL